MEGIDKRLANLRPAKKGEVRNPNGVNISKEIREARRYTIEEVESLIRRLFFLTEAETEAILESSVATNVERMFASVILASIKKGDVTAASFLLDRAGCRLPPLSSLPKLTEKDLSDTSDSELLELNRKAVELIANSLGTKGDEKLLSF